MFATPVSAVRTWVESSVVAEMHASTITARTTPYSAIVWPSSRLRPARPRDAETWITAISLRTSNHLPVRGVAAPPFDRLCLVHRPADDRPLSLGWAWIRAIATLRRRGRRASKAVRARARGPGNRRFPALATRRHDPRRPLRTREAAACDLRRGAGAPPRPHGRPWPSRDSGRQPRQ